MREQQHLHGKLGDAIYGRKKNLFANLKAGMELKTAIAKFVLDLQRALAQIVSDLSKGESS